MLVILNKAQRKRKLAPLKVLPDKYRHECLDGSDGLDDGGEYAPGLATPLYGSPDQRGCISDIKQDKRERTDPPPAPNAGDYVPSLTPGGGTHNRRVRTAPEVRSRHGLRCVRLGCEELAIVSHVLACVESQRGGASARAFDVSSGRVSDISSAAASISSIFARKAESEAERMQDAKALTLQICERVKAWGKKDVNAWLKRAGIGEFLGVSCAHFWWVLPVHGTTFACLLQMMTSARCLFP